MHTCDILKVLILEVEIMGKNSQRYSQMQHYMTFDILANTGLFILYLIFASFGIVWLKAITAILSILLSIFIVEIANADLTALAL